MELPKHERKLAKHGVAVVSFNAAKTGFGDPPSQKSCTKGVWTKNLKKSKVDHEIIVVYDDREHKKGNVHSTFVAPIGGQPANFPMAWVLNHNGRVMNKVFKGLEITKAEKLAIEVAKQFDKDLEEAKKEKPDSDKASKPEDNNSSESKKREGGASD